MAKPNIAQQVELMNEENATKAQAMVTTRDALRAALEASNRAGQYAAQFTFGRDGKDVLGVWGHIETALRLMGEDEALAHFFDGGEWPND